MSDYTFDSIYDTPNHVEHTKPSVHEPFLFLNAGDDVVAPPTDDFDSYLDKLLIGNNLDNLHVPTVNPQIQFLGSKYNCGPSSAFTFSSSESSYDTRSTHSESSYGYPPRDAALAHSFSLGLDSELQRLSMDTQALAFQVAMDCIDPATFDTPLSPPNFMLTSANLYGCESSFPNYGLSTSTGNYSNQLGSYGTTAGVNASTDQITSLFAGFPSITLGPSTDDSRRGAPCRKHKCTICTRAFDRAFNLKTHMDTHNPNRKKPFICKSCDRAFSRKHDLVRHITSLHRKEATPSTSPKSVGVSKGTRKWCDNCGKGSIDNFGACNCNESDEVK